MAPDVALIFLAQVVDVVVPAPSGLSETVFLAIIGGVVSIVTAVVGLLLALLSARLKEVHTQINSRMDELLRVSKEAAEMAGKVAGVAEEKQRAASASAPVADVTMIRSEARAGAEEIREEAREAREVAKSKEEK